LLPRSECLQKFGKLETVVLFRKQGEIARRAGEQGTAPGCVSARVVMKRDRNLDESLKEFAIFGRSFAPHILQNFVSLKVFAGVEERDAFAAAFGYRTGRGHKHSVHPPH